MSFLLDALGKADHDRRRSEVPELRIYNQAGRSPMRRALRGVVFISLLLLFFALGYFLRPLMETNLFSHGDEAVGGYLPSRTTENPVNTAIEAPSARVITVENAPQAPVRSAFELEVISYSESPTARFAMINGTMLREGEILGSGEVLLTIERDAVVLEKAGKQIRVGM